MGSDINAVFGHRESFPPTEAVVETIRAGMGGNWKLMAESDSCGGTVLVSGEFGIYFGPHAAIACSGEGWPLGPEVDEIRREVICALRSLARIFRSPSVIFLPDDIEPWMDAHEWVGKGMNLEEVRQKLASFKEPAPDLPSACRFVEYNQQFNCMIYEVDGYVVEELNYDAHP